MTGFNTFYSFIQSSVNLHIRLFGVYNVVCMACEESMCKSGLSVLLVSKTTVQFGTVTLHVAHPVSII